MNGSRWQHSSLLQWIFYGNFFYGICAVAQSVEASLQQRFPLNSIYYYVAVFLAAVLYYNYPYARKYKDPGNNPRTAWYIKHYRFLFWNQVIITIIALPAAIFFLYNYSYLIRYIHWQQWVMLLVFPLIAGLYYGLNFLSARYNLRSIGWLKPFVIGFTWAGLIVIYPVLWQNIQAREPYHFTLFGNLLFIKNLMFIAMLCIMFDVKDYASDHSSRLRTFVVKLGLRKTIFYVLIPLTLLGLLTFISYGLTHHFSFMKIALNMVPFLLMLMAAYSLRRRRSMLYYHVAIDGLMLVKAACGIIAMSLF